MAKMVLLKNANKQIQKTLYSLRDKRIGWPTKIQNMLEKYNLPTDFESIRSKPIARWHRLVTSAIEVKNHSRIKDDLHKVENGESVLKTKTKSIFDKISDPNYTRQIDHVITRMTKHDTKTLMIARYGMLDCGMNYKGNKRPNCNQCNVPDNEQHRLDVCPEWDSIRINETDGDIVFEDIYKNDIESLRPVMKKINSIWNTKYTNGSMNK